VKSKTIISEISQTSLEGFYEESSAQLPSGIAKEIGHFNVFVTEALFANRPSTSEMPYSRRAYYKISWIRGKSKAEYADKTIDIPQSALLFATPKIPYNWVPEDGNQTGMFCIFTADFLAPGKAGVDLDDLPLFQPGQVPVFQLDPDDVNEIEYIFKKMHKEIASDYRYKYDLLRNLVLELIH
jgi:AraC family transcriptional activator of pobA